MIKWVFETRRDFQGVHFAQVEQGHLPETLNCLRVQKVFEALLQLLIQLLIRVRRYGVRRLRCVRGCEGAGLAPARAFGPLAVLVMWPEPVVLLIVHPYPRGVPPGIPLGLRELSERAVDFECSDLAALAHNSGPLFDVG